MEKKTETTPQEKAQKPATSRGEKLFDMLTYGGISFAGVFIATMPWTYYTKYGNGKKLHDWMTKKLVKNGFSEGVAEQTFNTAVLGSLGNAAIIPVKILENYKPAIVDKFNDWLGDDTHASSVDHEPKQSWTSLVVARVAAYTAVFASLQGALAVLGGERFKKFEEKFAENVVCKPMGYATHTPGLPKSAATETKAFRYGKIAALDVFATAAATILLYAGSKMLARKNETWHTTHPENAPHPAEPQPAPQPESAPEPRFAQNVQRKTPVTATPRETTHAETIAARKRLSEEASPTLSA